MSMAVGRPAGSCPALLQPFGVPQDLLSGPQKHCDTAHAGIGSSRGENSHCLCAQPAGAS